MDQNLNEALTKAVRLWARETTPEELKKRGARLRSISLARMAVLLEKAVNRTLMARTVGELRDEDQDSFSEQAREEFMRLVRDEPPPDEGGIEQKAQTELERLKIELAKRRAVLQVDERKLQAEEGPPPEQALDLERQLRALFASRGGSIEDPAALEQEVVEVATRELRLEHERAEAARLREDREEIDRLERRISKLASLLGQTEVELARLLQAGTIEGGVASIYRTVQGLDLDDTYFMKKSELITAVFEANMKLKEDLTAATG